MIHHLAIDGISWRPMLEDLETAYRQIQAGRPVKLPPKTTSYKTWAEQLVQYSKSEVIQEESAYWKSVTEPRRVADSLNVLAITKEAAAKNSEGAATALKLSLSPEETRACCRTFRLPITRRSMMFC